jgi:serine/threonine protein kinase
MHGDARNYDDLSAVAAEIDHVCDEFERSFRNAQHPCIEELLQRVPDDLRSRLLKELLLLEWDLGGDLPAESSIETYRLRFPAFKEIVDEAFEIVSSAASARRSARPADASPRSTHAIIVDPTVDVVLKDSQGDRASVDIFAAINREQTGSTTLAGLVLGDYVLLEPIGAGGMGRVYKARHPRMNRIVAIKLIANSSMRDETAIKRFLRETEAAARLEHPNIVTAYHAGVVGELHYLVMQYVEGHDLSNLVRTRGPLSVAQALDCIRQAAEGLAFAHRRGVIHRDIKPANLLRDHEGVVKVLDLGLARIVADDADLTSNGRIMGTVDYMSPEQAYDPTAADARSDVYSLGCTLWYLLTGRSVYQREQCEARLAAHRDAPLPALRQFRTDCPPAVEALLWRMIAKRPEDRYQTMNEVSAAVADAASGGIPAAIDSPSVAREATADRRTPWMRSSSRRRTVQIGGTLLVCGAAVAASLGWFSSSKEPPRDAPATQATSKGAGASAIAANSAISTPSSVRSATGAPRPTSPGASPTLRSAPGPLPTGADVARQRQAEWAERLRMEIESKNSIEMRMTLIPPGEFLMGSTDEQIDAALEVAERTKVDFAVKAAMRQTERPQHPVAISAPFLIGTMEVTIGQFRKFFDEEGYETEAEVAARGPFNKKPYPYTYLDPGRTVTDEHPAAYITWNDASAFCAWLSKREQANYRLPTEAEWEYACRAGTTTQYSFGDDESEFDRYGWYVNNNNPGPGPKPCGTKLPNGFGVYDMHGNLDEWCGDFFAEQWYSESPKLDPTGPALLHGTRVVRGGYYNYPATDARCALRKHFSQSHRYPTHGFRCVRVLDAAALSGHRDGTKAASP